MVRNKLKKEELLFRFTIGKNNRLCLRNKKSAPVRALSYRGNYIMNLNEFKSKFFKKANGCAIKVLPHFNTYSVLFEYPQGRIEIDANYYDGEFHYLYFWFTYGKDKAYCISKEDEAQLYLEDFLKAVEDSGVLND